MTDEHNTTARNTGQGHTPGPWRVVADESASQVTGFPCIEANGYTVVGTEGMYGDIDTDFANARLIAAAPDMLEALAAQLYANDEASFQQAKEKTLAALAKATGGAA